MQFGSDNQAGASKQVLKMLGTAKTDFPHCLEKTRQPTACSAPLKTNLSALPFTFSAIQLGSANPVSTFRTCTSCRNTVAPEPVEPYSNIW